VLRTLRTPFFDDWTAKRDEAARRGDELWMEIIARNRSGHRTETLMPAGQTAGGIDEILPVAEILRRLLAETEADFGTAMTYVS